MYNTKQFRKEVYNKEDNQFFKSFCLTGMLLVFIGLYFSFIWAGIPYQDPTTEMTIQWTVNYLAGLYCMRCGGIVIIIDLFGVIDCQCLLHKK